MSDSTTRFTHSAYVCIFIILLLLVKEDESLQTVSRADRKIANTEQRIHPNFDFNKIADLDKHLFGLPRLPNRQIAHRFLTLAGNMLNLKPEILLLITKKHGMLDTFKTGKLVELDDYPEINKTVTGMKLNQESLNALLPLLQAAREDGINLIVSSTFRSYSRQEEIFTYYIQTYGPEWTSKYSAPPGHSQHQLATTVDFTRPGPGVFAGSAEEIWLQANAGRFGWSLSYPMGKMDKTGYEWESWHWRWIGEDAVKMQNEFFKGMQQDTLEFWLLNCRKLRAARLNRQL